MSGDFDARLRQLFAGVDTAPGFEARVMQRIAALRQAPRVDLRGEFERKRMRVAKDLARQAWMNVASAVGVGAAGIALVWRHEAAVAALVREAVADPGNLVVLGCAMLAAGLWPFLQKYLPR